MSARVDHPVNGKYDREEADHVVNRVGGGMAVHVVETVSLKKYYGRSRGIEDVSLEVREGEIFGFIGPNGAGKSTTIRTLLGFIFPTGGSARVLGMDVVSESRKIKAEVGYLASEVGYYDDMTSQDLFDYSARFYSKDCRRRTDELIDLFEVDRRRRIHALSMGNKKKVGIVQALLHEPRLLILDEPTSNLDPLMQRKFFELLRAENKKGVTIFFSSHVLSEVQRLCDRVAIIKEGRILKVEDMAALRGNEFRRVRISFRAGQEAEVRLPGVVHSSREHGILNLLYNGDVNALVRLLAGREIENLWLEEPSLEEVFMHYYEKEEN
jgi:ABC-2 type transport system ATP-binding protein